MNRTGIVRLLSRLADRLPLVALQSVAALVLVLPLIGLVVGLVDVGNDALRWPLGMRQVGLLLRSVGFSSTVAVSATVLGAALAWGVMGRPRGWMILTLTLPPLLILPLSIHGLNWATAILQFNDSYLRHHSSWQITGWFAAWLAEVLAMLPLAVGIAWTGFGSLDRRLLEAAMLCRGTWVVAWRVALPMARLVLVTGTVLLFLLSLSDYTVPSLFAVQVYALEIFATYSASVHPSGAIIAALPLMGVIGIGLGVVLRRGVGESLFCNPCGGGMWPCRVPGWYGAAACGILVLVALLPLGALAMGAGDWLRLRDAVVGARDELWVSLRVAALSAGLVALLGMIVAENLARGRVRMVWWGLVATLFALPAPLVGIGLLRIASSAGGWLEPWLPVWACVARFLPVGSVICHAVLVRMDRNLLEAARVYQYDRWHGTRRVVLPLAWRGWVVAVVAGFTLSMGELGASILVAPPGEATLIIRLYNLLHYGASNEVAALGLALALPALAAGLVLVSWLGKSS